MQIRFSLLMLLLPFYMFGQLTNVVAVTAARASTSQPDHAVFDVNVTAPPDKTLDDVVSALSGSGITSAHLVGLSTPFVDPFGTPVTGAPNLSWFFRLIVPLARIKDTSAALAALQISIPQKNSAMTLSSAVFTQASAPAQSCDVGGLINDARAQAQKLAGAAGLSAGFIIGITGTTDPSASCLLTVKFALGLMFAQGPFAITVVAVRDSVSGPADAVLIGLTVTSSLTTGFDEVTQAVKNAGITGAKFTGVSTQTEYVTPERQDVLAWTFTETAPLAKLSSTLTQLAAAQHALTTAGLSLGMSVQGIASSAQPVCSDADLVADARTYAQKIAAAAGVSAGSILTLSDQWSPVGSVTPASSYSFAGTPPAFAGSLVQVLYGPGPPCARTVQFQLGN